MRLRSCCTLMAGQLLPLPPPLSQRTWPSSSAALPAYAPGVSTKVMMGRPAEQAQAGAAQLANEAEAANQASEVEGRGDAGT